MLNTTPLNATLYATKTGEGAFLASKDVVLPFSPVPGMVFHLPFGSGNPTTDAVVQSVGYDIEECVLDVNFEPDFPLIEEVVKGKEWRVESTE